MTARTVFQQHLHTHAEQTGFLAPMSLIEYLIDMITDRMTRSVWQPDLTFAERYLDLYHSSHYMRIREFGDDTLVFVSVWPEWGARRGLDVDYYAAMAISAYYTYADLVHDARFTQLGNWFYHLQRFLHSAMRARPCALCTQFA